jgi:hypothetical protein
MCTKVEEQLSIPVSMLNNIMVNKNFSNAYILSEREKKLQTSRDERTESVLLEWFEQKWTLYIPIQGQMFKVKAEEIVLKLNTKFTLDTYCIYVQRFWIIG